LTKEYEASKRLNTLNYIEFSIDKENNKYFEYKKYKGQRAKRGRTAEGPEICPGPAYFSA
jgi:hypothetical protein